MGLQANRAQQVSSKYISFKAGNQLNRTLVNFCQYMVFAYQIEPNKELKKKWEKMFEQKRIQKSTLMEHWISNLRNSSIQIDFRKAELNVQKSNHR